MGFFSGITSGLGGLSGILGGGSQQQSSGSQQSTSGFSLLPKPIQQSYTGYSGLLNNWINNPSATSQIFTPMGQTPGETQAYTAINKGFTPDAGQLQSDISMQTNPFDSSVIDEINRQGQGQNSILQQNLDTAGQSGSNRQMLSANDIDLSRLQQIGTFKQSEYNQALQNALQVLPQSRAQDAALQLGAGGAQRQLALQTATAPITGLSSLAQLLSALPQTGGQQSSQSNQASTNSSENGTFGNLLSTVGSVAKFLPF